MYPLARPHRPLLGNALLALCDFTADNGATRVVNSVLSAHYSRRAPVCSYETATATAS